MKPERNQSIDNGWASPPSRGVWIETHDGCNRYTEMTVAPLAGGVD